jgi:hypothetical protein
MFDINSTDYFIVSGYRKMVLSLLKQTASDLLLEPGVKKNDVYIKAAKDWVMFSPGKDSFQPGLTFADCIYALGEASSIDHYRNGFLARPQAALLAATKALEAINMDEGVYEDPRKPNLLSTGHFDASWLHSTKRPVSTMVG